MKIGIDSVETTKFTKQSGKETVELASQSIINLLKKTRIDRKIIDGIIVSSCSSEQYLGNILSEMAGINPKVSTKVENLCNSGTTAIILAYSLILSNICKAVIVTGVEKGSSPGNKLVWDMTRGIYDMPIHWAALFAKAHFRNYNTTEEDLALISEKNHRYANKNPKALFYGKKFSLTEIITSEKIIDPLKKLDCCYPCDGASSLLMISDKISSNSDEPIWIKGLAQSNYGASFGSISEDLRSILSTKIASKEAFKKANLRPKDIDIAEIHDAFSILELLAYEDIGFIEKGKGSYFIKENQLPTNTRGGLLGCGHPIGATGIAQTCEIVMQLKNEAFGRQIKNCNRGLVHNMAAAGTSSSVLILEN
jgi:acetyl-CoA C-acetyltransferase